MKEHNEVHIAIVDIPTIKKIVSKNKTIESRFSKNKIKPFDLIQTDDMILLKASGKDLFGYFYVDYVESLTNFNIIEVEKRYNDKIVADKSFWESKKDARYATLIHCKNPVMANSGIFYQRKGMDGWIVVPYDNNRQVICFAGQICSGKTTYAKQLAEVLDAQYVHFGTIIRNYAKEHGYSDDRNSLQKVGQIIMETLGYSGLMDLAVTYYHIENTPRNIIFDGVRHKDILNEIKRRYSNVKLVYVKATDKERYKRYISRTNETITKEKFIYINRMPVEMEATELEKEANYVINSRYEENLNESVTIIGNIIACLLNGHKIL